MESLLADVYFNPDSPACYAGVNAVFKEAKRRNKKVRLEVVKQFLSAQDAYSLHKPIKKRFSRNKMTSPGLNVKWQIDLADLQKIKTYNKGYCFLVVCIDVFSRFAHVEPVKNKRADTVALAFAKITQRHSPWILYSDKGKEFHGAFEKLLKTEGIRHVYATSTDVKCAIVERFIRTLKTRIWKHFTRMKTKRYYDVLPKIVDAINHSTHRIIDRTPASISYANQNEVWKSQLPVVEKPAFSVGDVVRITKEKNVFRKGYMQNFVRELFTIERVLTKRQPIVYKLKDVDAIFYKEELQKIATNESKTRKVARQKRIASNGKVGRKVG